MRGCLLFAALSLGLSGCSADSSSEANKFNVVSVSRCIANGVTEPRIAQCTAWTDRFLNHHSGNIDEIQLSEGILAQNVWTQSAQVKVTGDVGPNSGRVTPNHFQLYGDFMADTVKPSSGDEVFAQYKICERELSDSICGFTELMESKS
ncbi:hypothetical protein N9W89_05030 [Hellea sp.]|nr:hypothetical protein [Hellea sp.]